ncbi:MAG: phage major capsid protein [Mycobacterium sp.]|nr:phage major capsid protein [Mycobacterium sp.]
MAITTINSSGILAPEEVGPRIIQPLRLPSVALRVSTVIETMRPSLRFPVVDSDAAAIWVAEGAKIDESDPGLVKRVRKLPMETLATPTDKTVSSWISYLCVAGKRYTADLVDLAPPGLRR